MSRLGPLLRISAGLVALTCSMLLFLDVLGFVPGPVDREAEERVRLAESLAAQLAPAGQRRDLAAIRATLEVTVRRSEEVLSAGLRGSDGKLMAASGDHSSLWQPERSEGSSPTHLRIPLFQGGRRWATIELCLTEPASAGGPWSAMLRRPAVILALLLAASGIVLYSLYLGRTLRHLDPSAVIPPRVQAALDVMVEGVLILDSRGQIVLANAAFAERMDRKPPALLGLDAAQLPWRTRGALGPDTLPWQKALASGEAVLPVALGLASPRGGVRSFVVNCAPVLDGWSRPKGAIATFDDVTELERSKAELEQALVELEKSRDEIRLQNEELQILARRDPLTGIANRRAFLERFEELFAIASASGGELCCIMVDIDHFKQVNDTHGHLMGDDVIRRVAEALSTERRDPEAVCRYGGEEFCMALEEMTLEQAAERAERIRRRIAAPGFARIPVTASFGVASIRSGAKRGVDLLNQADQALYASKTAGRDRVTRWEDS